MLELRIVCGQANSGKSFFINSQKEPQDDIIDLFFYQKNCSDFLKAEYIFYSKIEDTIRKNKDGIIWIETIFAKRYRRVAVLKFFQTLAEGLNLDVKFKLYYISASKQRYIENYKIRFPYQTPNENAYEKLLAEIELPSLDEGWDSIDFISYDL